MRVLIVMIFSMILFSCETPKEFLPEGVIESEALQFTVDTLATGLENPWSMAFLPDGRILIAERPGRLRIFENNVLLPESIEGLPDIWATGQGGLLDLALHPEFEKNRLIYLAYAKESNGSGNTALSRGKLQDNTLTNTELLFHGDPLTNSQNHFGTRIVLDGRGYVFFAIGDRTVMENAQDLTNHNGKIMRLYENGDIPEDNPFINDPNARPEIWTYGHRNIQGMSLHPLTGDLWAHEHGPMGGDELNLIQKGKNYGWPLATYGTNYDGSIITPDTTLPGITDPIFYWVPSIAPCGMTFVTSEKYPGWKNNILLGALAGKHIHRLVFEGEHVIHNERLLEGFARIRDVRQGPDGFIYVLSEEPGIFLRIIPWK